jgi:hypothetical protein
MPNTPKLDRQKSAILTRAIRPENDDLSLAAARALLRFRLAERDCARLHVLLVKNQEEDLTVDERDELDGFMNIGMLLDILQAKARAALARTVDRSSRAHG